MIFVAILFTLVVLGLIQYILHVQRMEKYLKDVKTLKRIPLIGNVMLFLGKPLQTLYEEIKEILSIHGTPFKVQLGPAFFMIIDHPEDMKTVLMSKDCLDRPYIYDFMRRPFSILAQRFGEEWKPIRKIMNPMLNSVKCQSFLTIFNEKASSFVQKLEKEVNGPHFDFMHYSSICILDLVCSTIMGINLNEEPDKGMTFSSNLDGMYDSQTKRFATMWAHIEFIYRWTNQYKKETKCLANMRLLTDRVIKSKTDAYLNSNNNSQEDSENPHKRTDSPLIPLCVEGKLNIEVAKQNIDTLLVAGHETTATTISYAILMLAMNPIIQEQVVNELHSLYETQDQETTYELMQLFDVLERVIKEAMRLFPSVFAFLRTSTVDIPLRDCVIPKGVIFALPLYTLHRRPDFWGEDAEEFNPEHFLPENVQKRHPFAYLPFSGGSRNCIGNQFAMFMMKVVLSALLRKYKFSTDLTMSELRPKFETTLRLSNKHMVRVERRNW